MVTSALFSTGYVTCEPLGDIDDNIRNVLIFLKIDR
jgi:hypothetical protein